LDYVDLIYAKKPGGKISCMCTFKDSTYIGSRQWGKHENTTANRWMLLPLI
jgi:hypothetical protein